MFYADTKSKSTIEDNKFDAISKHKKMERNPRTLNQDFTKQY